MLAYNTSIRGSNQTCAENNTHDYDALYETGDDQECMNATVLTFE
jgi:hypothetical protein